MENILETIKKLHMLSENNDSPEQAALAADKIQELCFKYNLELGKILESPDKSNVPYDRHYYVAKADHFSFLWQSILFHAITQSNFCYDMYTPGTTRFTIIGQKHNVEVITYTFEYLIGEIQRLADKHTEEQGFISKRDRRFYKQNFAKGAGVEIARILRGRMAKRTTATTESTALVVTKGAELQKEVQRFYPSKKDINKGGKTAYYRTGAGYSDGREAAKNISINPGLGSSNQKRIGE